MRKSTPLTILLASTCLILPTSCGGGAEEGANGAAEESGNDHAAEMEAMGAVDLGSVTVGQTTFKLDAPGPATAGETVMINGHVTDGTLPETVRLWYGIESGQGSMKAKAGAHDDHFHADVEIPAEPIEGAKLWIEAQTAAGDKDAQSVAYAPK